MKEIQLTKTVIKIEWLKQIGKIYLYYSSK